MTPLELQIAIHYHVSPSDFRDGDVSAPAVREAIDAFVVAGLLQETHDHGRRGGNARYCSTARLDAFVQALCKLDLPVQTWAVPWLPAGQR